MSVHMPPTHNQKTPCQHQQDTHKQETAHTPPKVRLKRHRNTNKITRRHNMTHIHARPSATKTHLRNKNGYTAGLHQDITDTPPRRHQITTDIPPISRPAEPRHNTPTTHNTTKPETDRKRSAQTTWRRHHQNISKHHDDTHSPTWAPHSAMPTQKHPRWAKMNPKQPKHELNPFFLQVKISVI